MRPVTGKAIVVAVALAIACGDSTTSPAGSGRALEFDPLTLDFGEARVGTIELRNNGERAIGPIDIEASAVRTPQGVDAPGTRVSASPADIPTLNPGTSKIITLTVEPAADINHGDYEATVRAKRGPEVLAFLGVRFRVPVPQPIGSSPVASIEVDGPGAPRQGDLVAYSATVRDTTGARLGEAIVAWSVVPEVAALMTADGRFVGYEPGPASVVASSGGRTDTLPVTIRRRNGPSGTFQVMAHGAVPGRFTSDLWAHGDALYTGTWRGQNFQGLVPPGNVLLVWDIRDRDRPVLTDSVIVDAWTVNDVKISPDGTVAVITHEWSVDNRNGITLLDLSDPHHPTIISRLTDQLIGGVHNVWAAGRYIYAADSRTPALRVIDAADPANPVVIANVDFGGNLLHDVYVRDGLAFISGWRAGLIIVDVGNGIVGGSPHNPVEVSRLDIPGYVVHNAWYWPATGYVFVGDELGLPGTMRVIDASDLVNPVEVASLVIAGAAPHNFWLDESEATLYLAWYDAGLRALDVSGELLGALHRQGREIANIQYGGGSQCIFGQSTATCTWAPQLHKNRIYVSDFDTGLGVLRRNW